MANVRRALLHSFVGGNAVTIIQIVATLAIARLLTPQDIGVYSVAAALVAIASVVRDFGVSPYLISARHVDRQTAKASFGLLLCVAGALAVATVSSAHIVAEFYGDRRVADILYLLALNFIITPLGAVTLALARRNMRFKAIAYVTFAGAAASAICSVSLSYLGWGPISLAWGGVAGSVVVFLCSIPLRPFPGLLWPTLRGATNIVHFGSKSAAAQIVAQLTQQSSDLILGRLQGLDAVAFFNKARSLPQYVHTVLNSVTGPVLLPWLAKGRRSDVPLHLSYSKAVEYTTGVSWPALAIVGVFAQVFTLILFGDQWERTADLAPYLCVAAAVASTYSICSFLYLSVERPGLDFTVQLIVLASRVFAILVSAEAGLDMVAIAWTASVMFGGVVQQIVMYRALTIRPRVTWQAVRKSAFVGGVALAVASGVKFGLEERLPDVYVAVIGALLALLGALFAALFIRHPLARELDRLRNVRHE